ncbi:MAG: phosphoglucose isomerase [Patescibacteria group bacterium]|jgi:glucose-6-phosphate isomerase|nr:phosphoglucose isomerase [Patescibacteria group bacterium]
MSLKFDYEYCLENATGDGNLSYEDVHDQAQAFLPWYNQVQQAKQAGELGFAKLPYQGDDQLGAVQGLADEVRNQFKNVIVVGIGGSDLGARAVHRALNHQFFNLSEERRNGAPRLFFLGDTTDPVAIQEVLDVVDLSETAVIVISKSGNTVEQMSTFVYLRSLLIEKVGEEAHRSHMIILTDAAKGALRDIVNKEGYRSLPVPEEVGGRFSVFTEVGLFPLAIVGIDIRGLLKGAADMDKHDSEHLPEYNMPALFALLQCLYYKRGKHISVFMPYSYSLREVGFWFRQLWAESLGKEHDLDGNELQVGPTPIAAVGPTDQHSQVQLYMEGPADKIFTFLTIENPGTNATLPSAYEDMEGVHYLKGHDFAEILAAEQKSTAYALVAAGRPSGLISLERLDAYHLGQLFYFLELATTYAGAIFNIDAFDQPGVETGKKYMYGLLGRAGFEDMKVPEKTNSYIINS